MKERRKKENKEKGRMKERDCFTIVQFDSICRCHPANGTTRGDVACKHGIRRWISAVPCQNELYLT